MVVRVVVRVVGRLVVLDVRALLLLDLLDPQKIRCSSANAAGTMSLADSGLQLLSPYSVAVHVPLTRRYTFQWPRPFDGNATAQSP